MGKPTFGDAKKKNREMDLLKKIMAKPQLPVAWIEVDPSKQPIQQPQPKKSNDPLAGFDLGDD